MTATWKIEREGFFFRAVCAESRSTLFTSASQAGRYIESSGGKEAHAEAAAAFLSKVAS